jgi:transcriptional regulator with XRE-family HTH domain
MDLVLVIRHRLKELGLDQRGLAAAAHVTESYISQLLAGKKAPPAPDRTDVYEKMEGFLGLPGGELAKLAHLQRQEYLKKRISDPPGSCQAPADPRHLRERAIWRARAARDPEAPGCFEKRREGRTGE